MRTDRVYVSIIVFSATICARADDLPTKLNFDRYKAMLDHSPFAVATAVVAPAATPNFAKDLYVANAARSPEGTMVTIASNSDKNFKIYLTTRAPVDGYAIAGIKWSHKVGGTKVTISKDGQLATLPFNQILLAQPLPNRSSSLAPPTLPQHFPKPVGFPTPNVRGVIQRNPQGQPANPSVED
jgi:hypothetical protein